MKLKFISFLLMSLIISCSVDNQIDDFSEDQVNNNSDNSNTENDDENNTNVYTSNREGQIAITPVFFYPKDYYPNNKEIENFGETLLFAQKWYEEQMSLNGFGRKTFALPVNSEGKVDIQIIIGKNNASNYVKNSTDILNEVNAYYEYNKEEKYSRYHTVAVPGGETEKIAKIWGSHEVGFCFTRASSDHMNLRSTGKFINDLELKTNETLGTLIHELGHLFGAPHLNEIKDDLPQRSIMGQNGTFTWYPSVHNSPELVMSTLVNATIWDNSEPFNRRSGINYAVKQPNPTSNVKYSIQKNSTKQATIVNVTFKSNVLPKRVYVAIGPNNDNGSASGGYRDVGFSSVAVATTNPLEYKATIEVPYEQYFINNWDDRKINNTNNNFKLRVILENWGVYNLITPYNFSIKTKPVPEDDINRSN